MKHIYSMQQLRAASRVSVLLSFIFFTHSTFALESATQKSNTTSYQSAFDGYQSATNDSPSDWKTINQSPSDGGDLGHQMQGMQHDMDANSMANMQSSDVQPINHAAMSHGSMADMNHQQMQHGNMTQTSMQTANNPDVEMPKMDHAQMQAMTHQHSEPAKALHQHKDDMSPMDHSKMADMPSMGEVAEKSHSEHHHASGDEMQSNDQHDPMPVSGQAPGPIQAKSEILQANFKIIPNLHPAIVHFPIALTLIALLFGLSARLLDTHSAAPLLAAAGHFTLWLAALGAMVAVIFGWLAFNSGMNHDDAGHAAMLLHRQWAIPSALGLVLLAGWDAWKGRINQIMSTPVLICLFVLSGTIATTAWLGGEIVYRHGIGVLSLPASEGGGHHHHDEAKTSEQAHNVATDESIAHQHDATQGESHEH